jgi:hypothetical protein
MVLRELEPKTYPPRTKGLQILNWGERNLEVLTKVAQGKGVGMPWGDLVFH